MDRWFLYGIFGSLVVLVVGLLGLAFGRSTSDSEEESP